jgi:hypothetical protein
MIHIYIFSDPALLSQNLTPISVYSRDFGIYSLTKDCLNFMDAMIH